MQFIIRRVTTDDSKNDDIGKRRIKTLCVIDAVGPTRFARFQSGYGIELGGVDWNGDHTFSQSALNFSLQEYITPEVAKKNPQFSSDEIRAEAGRILALRFVQDQSFDQKETRREDEIVTKWEVVEVDGKKQLVTQYGDRHVSLEELWQHTKEFALRVGKAEAFNPAEMQTQLAVQDALISGRATSVAFTLSHPESIRYVQQWQQGSDGSFYSTQIDIGKHAGRDLRHDEIKSFLDRFRDQHRDTTVEVEGAIAGSYIAVRGSLDVAAISRAARLHTMTMGVESFTRRHFSDDLPSRGSPDASDGAFPLWVIRDRRWFGENKKDTSQPDAFIKKQERASNIITKRLHQESVSDGRIVVKEYEARQAVRNSLKLIVETGVASHAAPVLLARLTEQLPAPVRAVEKSIRRHEEKVRKVREVREVRKARTEGKSPPAGEAGKKEKGKIVDSAVKVIKKDRVDTVDKTEEHKKRMKRGEEKGIKNVAVAELLIPSALKKRKGRGERRFGRVIRTVERTLETKRLSKREKRMWVTLVIAAMEFKRLASGRQLTLRSWEKKKYRRMHTTDEKKERKPGFQRAKPGFVENVQSQEREAIAGLRYAWAALILLHHANMLSTRGTLATVISREERKRVKLVHPNGVDQPNSADREKEPTPWILLSIIWYLTAIREQGQQNYPIIQLSNIRNKKMKTKQTLIPQRGVIFAYAS